mmetsp:Transcript_5590/g.19982  ORF Transcript_5590/g.19982 Transcript_5590/m.19982 type:complete len:877 (-) Transcript_5590:249-2879(-)
MVHSDARAEPHVQHENDVRQVVDQEDDGRLVVAVEAHPQRHYHHVPQERDHHDPQPAPPERGVRVDDGSRPPVSLLGERRPFAKVLNPFRSAAVPLRVAHAQCHPTPAHAPKQHAPRRTPRELLGSRLRQRGASLGVDRVRPHRPRRAVPLGFAKLRRRHHRRPPPPLFLPVLGAELLLAVLLSLRPAELDAQVHADAADGAALGAHHATLHPARVDVHGAQRVGVVLEEPLEHGLGQGVQVRERLGAVRVVERLSVQHLKRAQTVRLAQHTHDEDLRALVDFALHLDLLLDLSPIDEVDLRRDRLPRHHVLAVRHQPGPQHRHQRRHEARLDAAQHRHVRHDASREERRDVGLQDRRQHRQDGRLVEAAVLGEHEALVVDDALVKLARQLVIAHEVVHLVERGAELELVDVALAEQAIDGGDQVRHHEHPDEHEHLCEHVLQRRRRRTDLHQAHERAVPPIQRQQVLRRHRLVAEVGRRPERSGAQPVVDTQKEPQAARHMRYKHHVDERFGEAHDRRAQPRGALQLLHARRYVHKPQQLRDPCVGKRSVRRDRHDLPGKRGDYVDGKLPRQQVVPPDDVAVDDLVAVVDEAEARLDDDVGEEGSVRNKQRDVPGAVYARGAHKSPPEGHDEELDEDGERHHGLPDGHKGRLGVDANLRGHLHQRLKVIDLTLHRARPSREPAVARVRGERRARAHHAPAAVLGHKHGARAPAACLLLLRSTRHLEHVVGIDAIHALVLPHGRAQRAPRVAIWRLQSLHLQRGLLRSLRVSAAQERDGPLDQLPSRWSLRCSGRLGRGRHLSAPPTLSRGPYLTYVREFTAQRPRRGPFPALWAPCGAPSGAPRLRFGSSGRETERAGQHESSVSWKHLTRPTAY